jgi:hypothetical protein
MKGSEASMRGGGFTGKILDNIANTAGSGAGFRPLISDRFPGRNIFRNNAVGLNFEHVLNGVAADRAINRFTPRTDRCVLYQHSERSVSVVHKAVDSTWDIESEMRYTLAGEDAIDLEFSVVTGENRYQMGYVAFMWASYLSGARDRCIYFPGECDGREGWVAFGESRGESVETGTVAAVGVPPLRFEDGADTLNVIESRRKIFSLPVYYGLLDGDGDPATVEDTMAYIMMFDQAENIRFAMWDFTRGEDGKTDPHCPAWDWQYVIRAPVMGATYSYRARLVYKPFIDRDDVMEEYKRWRGRDS